jgi:hypothetical protein
MAYSVSKESLVPLLTRCITRHGTIKAISEFPSSVSEKGGDATVTEEFIALREIRKYDDSNEMIQASFERAVEAYIAALNEAEAEIKELKVHVSNHSVIPKSPNPMIANLKYIVLWFGVVGIAAWMDDENFSATLAASVVIAGTALLCFLAFLSRNSQSSTRADK